MFRAWKEWSQQLRYQIIVPFLLLTTLVVVGGALVVIYLLGQSLQERFDNQLAAVTRVANDTLITQEQANLGFLREVAFALPNEASGAPAVAVAIANRDTAGLQLALNPIFVTGALRTGVNLDRLIAFDSRGQTVADFERPAGSNAGSYITHTGSLDLSQAWFTARVLSGATDTQGDKYAGLIEFADTETVYFATIAPVRQGEQVVGGVIAAIRVDDLLATIAKNSQAAGITLYDQAGRVIGSTFGDSAPDMSLELLNAFDEGLNQANQAVFSPQSIGEREYQFAYVPLIIRDATVGVLAPALPRDDVLNASDSALWTAFVIIGILAAAIIVTGVLITRRITKPLEELVYTAHQISGGNTSRRAQVKVNNEIGVLGRSFNQMTDTLTTALNQVRIESSQRAAIVQSITDGIVVINDDGYTKSINRATRRLLSIGDDDPYPANINSFPMKRLTEGVPGFGSQYAQNLYILGDYIVRATPSPVVNADGTRDGFVIVLQDMTAEVAVDRAKTNFIGTISHELRTPLQVIRGNAELLLRGLAGDMNEDQGGFVDVIRLHANNMTSLVQNVIVIANLDSGGVTTELVLTNLKRPIDEAAWTVQSQIKAKGLSLSINLPEELRPVLADPEHVRLITYQLLDNARRYTSEGEISVKVIDCGTHARIEVTDTGRGVPLDMQDQIFQRFVRGDGVSEGINSSERGIGLGLAICKQLVERQGGTIGVTSAPNQGSTFYFTLRYANDTPSPEKSKVPMAA